MSSQTDKTLSGYIFEEESSLSLSELCRSCQMPAEVVIKLVEHGIVTPEGGIVRHRQAHQWQFQRREMIRADKALRLERDLGINYEGIALVLDLLEEMDGLRRQVYQLQALETLTN